MIKYLITSILVIKFILFNFTCLSAKEVYLVAKINNKAVTNLELHDRYNFVLLASKVKISSENDKTLLLRQILDKIIDEELISQDATSFKIDVDQKEIDKTIEILAEKQGQNISQFKEFFQKNNLSYKNYLNQIKSEILWSKIISNIIKPRVKVADFEVREFFEQKNVNIEYKKYNISEIVILNNKDFSKTFAEKILSDLKNGADFKSFVKQFSSGFSMESDGKIGWVYKSDIDARIYNEISKLKVGEYSNVILLDDGFHIFKLNEVKSEIKISEQESDIAKNAIFLRELQNQAKGYLIELRRKAFIEVSL